MSGTGKGVALCSCDDDLIVVLLVFRRVVTELSTQQATPAFTIQYTTLGLVSPKLRGFLGRAGNGHKWAK
eukprot:6088572-Pyramimonas_sp.AAC.1